MNNFAISMSDCSQRCTNKLYCDGAAVSRSMDARQRPIALLASLIGPQSREIMLRSTP